MSSIQDLKNLLSKKVKGVHISMMNESKIAERRGMNSNTRNGFK